MFLTAVENIAAAGRTCDMFLGEREAPLGVAHCIHMA